VTRGWRRSCWLRKRGDLLLPRGSPSGHRRKTPALIGKETLANVNRKVKVVGGFLLTGVLKPPQRRELIGGGLTGSPTGKKKLQRGAGGETCVPQLWGPF